MTRVEGGKEKEKLDGLIVPSIENEYSRLKKVMVVESPKLITSFTDLVVNPIQKEALEKVKEKNDVVVYPGAAECHKVLVEALEKHGVEVVKVSVQPIKKGHTPLFTRDVGVIIEDVFVPSRMRYDYRQVEVPVAMEKINTAHVFDEGFEYALEGGDVMFLEKDLILVGIGPRTDIHGLELLRGLFPEKTFVPFSTVKRDKAFHIDTNMGILGEKKLVVLPELVPQEILEMLIDRDYQMVLADPNEYMTCCTNVIALDDGLVISPAENISTNRNIRDMGVEVIEVSLREILSFGGGPHCLTLPLVRENA